MVVERQPSRVVRLGVPTLGFLLPAVATYGLLRLAWPIQHDLSDIGTGLIRLMLSFGAGLVGALAAHLVLRISARR